MTNAEIQIVLHKALKLAPEYGLFNLLDAVNKSLDEVSDQDEMLSVASSVRAIFLQKYGYQDSFRNSWLMKLNDAGRWLQSLPVENSLLVVH